MFLAADLEYEQSALYILHALTKKTILSIPDAKAHSKDEPTKKTESGLWAERAAMKVPVGDPVLDSALGGGLPNNGVILKALCVTRKRQ